MTIVSIDPRDRTPIYAQLERGLRAAIATGRLQAGEQLPTVRQLAVELEVNANTVARVYAELERAGVLETSAASGRSSAPRRRSAHRRASTTGGCARCRPACSPTPTRRASPSTTSIGALQRASSKEEQ